MTRRLSIRSLLPRLSLILGVVLLGLASSADAIPNLTTLQGQCGGHCRAVAVQGNYAYLGEGKGLTVLDVSNTAKPVVVGRMLLPFHNVTVKVTDAVRAVAVSGNHAYVAFGGNICAIDVSNPAKPTFVSKTWLNEGGAFDRLALLGQELYATGTFDGYRICDISDPANIKLNLPSYPATNALTPATLGALAKQVGPGLKASALGQTAYVASQINRLDVVDVTNASSPQLLTPYPTVPAVLDVLTTSTATGSVGYLAGHLRGVITLDLSTPATPSVLGQVDTPGLATALALKGTKLYVADDEGLQIIDVSNPAQPVRKGSYRPPLYATDVALSGNMAYVTGDGGLKIIDLRNPAQPVLCGFYPTPAPTRNVLVIGNHAYVTDVPGVYGQGPARGLWVLDVSEPTSPTLVANCALSGETTSLFATATRLYVGLAKKGVDIIDLAKTPTLHTRLGGHPCTGEVRQVLAVGSRLYVAEGMNGLRVLDVANVSSPTTSLVYRNPAEGAFGLAHANNQLYVSGVNKVQVLSYASDSTLTATRYIWHEAGDRWDYTIRRMVPYTVPIMQTPRLGQAPGCLVYPDDGDNLKFADLAGAGSSRTAVLMGGESWALVGQGNYLLDADNAGGGLVVYHFVPYNAVSGKWLELR